MFAKVFSSLWDGSLRGQPGEQLVFIYLLTHCDEAGEVDVLPAKVGDDTGLGEERVRAALAVLEAPDGASRSAEEEGRRLVRLSEHRDWGWRIVNYEHYRGIRNRIDRRIQNRVNQQIYRERKRTSSPVITKNLRKQASAESAQADADVEAEEKKDLDSVLGSISDSVGVEIKTASKLAGGKDPGPRWWNSPRVQAKLKILKDGGHSTDESRSLVLAQARAEGWA